MTDNPNRKIAWLVFEDKKRDYSAAEHFGDIRVVYPSVGRDFIPSAAVAHARRVLGKMEPDDYLVMSGDPSLCAICVTVAVERFGYANVLRWDRNYLKYTPMTLSFD